MRPIRREYLGDPERVREGIETVAQQGKAEEKTGTGYGAPDRGT
jgi:hypothetical protein